MYCSKCGNEIKEGEKFCSKCGVKLEEEKEYESKLARANNAAKIFFNKEKPTVYEYKQVCTLFGEVEKIGEISKTYIEELKFFIKANLLDEVIFFNTVNEFEKVYDNLIQLALSNSKTDEEREIVKRTFNKEKTINEFKEKLDIKKQKQKKKNIIISSIIMLLIVPVITVGIIMASTKPNANVLEKIETDKETLSSILEKNKIGLLKGKNIKREEYNQNNDLVAYIYEDSNGNEKEKNLDYEYDNLKRITKINIGNGIYLNLSYVDESKKILKIVNNFAYVNMFYDFIYEEGSEYPIIVKTSDLKNEVKYEGFIYFEEQELNERKYILAVETDENNTIITKKINLKENMKNDSIFEILEAEPTEYWSGPYNNEENIRSLMLETIISLDFSKIISHGKEIYVEDKNNKKDTSIYDDKNRIIQKSTNNNIQYFYKYEDINDNMYECTNFLYANSEALMAAGATEEESKKYCGTERVSKIYLDDNKQVIKVEIFADRKIIKEEANEKLKEYKQYVDSKKIDTSMIEFNNMENRLKDISDKLNNTNDITKMQNEEIIQSNSITNSNMQISNNNSQNQENENVNQSQDDIEKRLNEIKQKNKEREETKKKEEEEAEKRRKEEEKQILQARLEENKKISKKEIDNTEVVISLEYSVNGKGYYRSEAYNIEDNNDKKELNKLINENEIWAFNFIVYRANTEPSEAHIKWNLKIKESGKSYDSSYQQRSIEVQEGNNTIMFEISDDYGYKRTITYNINVKKLGHN